jgi:ubiquinone/menaquinone biosynthesis C-methylase UbiE
MTARGGWLSDITTMQPKLQRRIQRYGWDLAADDYEPLWRTQLVSAQKELLTLARLAPGERVLDVACGTGIVTLSAAHAVGADGHVLGVDLSGQMVDSGRRRAEALGLSNVSFERMDAEQLDIPDASFDVALCSLGLMYAPEPEQAVREMRRVLCPAGASSSPCGANARVAAGRRCSRSWTPK